MTYTTSDKIAAFLQTSAFSSSTIPTSTVVGTWIGWVDSEINSYTKNSFTTTTITKEYHDIRTFTYDYEGFIEIQLRRKNIVTFATISGDKVEVWSGNSWVDFVATKTVGRGGDYWVNEEDGVLYIKQAYFTNLRDGIRITYRYGLQTVPGDVEMAATMLVAAKIVQNDIRTLTPAGEVTSPRIMDNVEKWQQEAYQILDRYRIMVVGSYG